MTLALLPLLLLLSLIVSSVTQPLDPTRPQTCNYEDLREETIRHIRWNDEKLKTLQVKHEILQSSYNEIQNAKFSLEVENAKKSKLLEGYKSESDDSVLLGLYMNAVNDSALLEIELNAMKNTMNDTKSEVGELKKELMTIRNFIQGATDSNVLRFLGGAIENKDHGIVDSFDGHMFYFSNIKRTWTGSKIFCNKMNGSLANILNERMNTNMKNKFRQIGENLDQWIGGQKQGYEWVWVNDSATEPILWYDWAPYEPSYGQNCLQMWRSHDYRWDNDDCFKWKRFVCAKA